MGIFFALRSALRPALTYTLQPYLKMHKPDGTFDKLAPAVKFDVSQRSARAVFAVYFVFSAILTMWSLRNKRNTKSKEDESRNQNLIFSEQSDTCRRLVGQFLGFLAADTVDVLILNKKFGVWQGDIFIHHALGLALFLYALVAKRAQTILSYVSIAELLVPCGVALWWMKATNSSQVSMKLIRVLGIIVLTMVRFPLFMNGARAIWLSPTQSMFPVDDEIYNQEKSTEEQPIKNQTILEHVKRFLLKKDSLLADIVHGNYNKLSGKCIPESIVFTLSIMTGLGLDYRWTKLYFDGLFSK